MNLCPLKITMETRLQSNEVRIPKPEFDLKGSIAAGPDHHLNSSTGSNNSNCNHYFKSSFARSLSSFGASPQSKSLDYAINYGLQRFSSIDEDGDGPQRRCYENSPLSMPPMYSTDHYNSTFEDEEVDTKPNMEQQSTESLVSSSSTSTVVRNVWTNAQTTSGSSNSSSSSSSGGGSNKNGITPVKCNSGRLNPFRPVIHHHHHHQQQQQQCSNINGCDSTEIEVLRLRKECQSLIEENRRLLNLSGIVASNGHSHASNVEAVILQSQVDTLQWQLKQVESSRQMYRAVMEEVVRFLERCHLSLDNMAGEAGEPITRSKSSHHVHHDADSSQMSNGSDNDQSIIASPSPPLSSASNGNKSGLFASRLRCSTIDGPKLFNRNLSNAAINSTIQTAGSYTNFRDFTWRRNRKPFNRTMSTVEVDSEKLSQEAFRLLRTANNLLNTQEPSLMLPKTIFDSTYSSPTPSPHLMPPSLNSSFCRKSNGRQSSASMRSCCDTNSTSSNSSGTSSVSSAAPKVPLSNGQMDLETDLVGLKSRATIERTKASKDVTGDHRSVVNREQLHPSGMLMQSEGESGFSSISSFQEIGLPLTQAIHVQRPSGSSNGGGSISSGDDSTTECDLTIQAVTKEEQPPVLPQRMPTMAAMAYGHRRWDSAPALPPKKSTSLHAFSSAAAKGEETLQVLWV